MGYSTLSVRQLFPPTIFPSERIVRVPLTLVEGVGDCAITHDRTTSERLDDTPIGTTVARSLDLLEFERPAQFLLERYGRDAEKVAAEWALTLEAEGWIMPAKVWRAVATALRPHSPNLMSVVDKRGKADEEPQPLSGE